MPGLETGIWGPGAQSGRGSLEEADGEGERRAVDKQLGTELCEVQREVGLATEDINCRNSLMHSQQAQTPNSAAQHVPGTVAHGHALSCSPPLAGWSAVTPSQNR